MRLKSSNKYIENNIEISTRVKPVRDTIDRVDPVCKRIGVTRISDITCMDKLYIPNYTAVLPGTEDSIWVYSGKGSTKGHAKASALMESIERYSSLSGTYSRTFITGTYSDLSKCYNKVLHPDEVVEPVNTAFNTRSSIVDFLPAIDILNNEEVLVPAELALSRYSPKLPSISAFQYSHTNGLASGNILEEAISHALCEVIERDATSIADLGASSIPYSILKRMSNSLNGAGYQVTRIPEDKFVDDPSIFPDVEISEPASYSEPIKSLVKRFADSGIPLLIKDITQKDIGIPTFVASSIEWITSGYGYFAKGYGTHPDARIALLRAITEVSQTRVGNIQGARDDLKKITYEVNDEIYRRKWQFMRTSSLSNRNNKTVKFSEIKTYVHKDLLDDIKFILNRLRKAGLKRAIIVDLTIPDVAIPVVRAIVPSLETFDIAKLFGGSELVTGSRARTHFKAQHS